MAGGAVVSGAAEGEVVVGTGIVTGAVWAGREIV